MAAANAGIGRDMNERVAKTSVGAVACAALAIIGFVLTSRLESFEPCRVLYRIPQAAQDSLACHVYSAISLASLAFSAAAVGTGLVAGFLAVLRRRGTPRP